MFRWTFSAKERSFGVFQANFQTYFGRMLTWRWMVKPIGEDSSQHRSSPSLHIFDWFNWPVQYQGRHLSPWSRRFQEWCFAEVESCPVTCTSDQKRCFLVWKPWCHLPMAWHFIEDFSLRQRDILSIYSLFDLWPSLNHPCWGTPWNPHFRKHRIYGLDSNIPQWWELESLLDPGKMWDTWDKWGVSEVMGVPLNHHPFIDLFFLL